MAAQHAQKTTMVFELRNDLTGQLQEVMLKNAHNMEPIGHDAGVGEPFSHQSPVSTGEINANHLDLLTPLQTAQEGRQLPFAAPRHDVKDPTVLQNRRTSSQRAAAMHPMLVDTRIRGHCRLSRSLALRPVNSA